MTAGAVIFAMGQDQIDYVAMARWSAQRVQRWLGLPTTLITDQSVDADQFDRVIHISRSHPESQRWFDDIGHRVGWHNQDRCDAFDLSPYDRTVLLDADYVVASDQLRPLIDHDRFWCFRHATALGPEPNFDTFGRHRYPMFWATVMIFGRDLQTKLLFDSMRMIRDNWQHYRDLYHIDSALFRNDFALSMALPLVNGHMQPTIPALGSMLNVMPNQQLRQLNEDRFEVEFVNDRRIRMRCVLEHQDFHAMGKRELGDIIAAH